MQIPIRAGLGLIAAAFVATASGAGGAVSGTTGLLSGAGVPNPHLPHLHTGRAGYPRARRRFGRARRVNRPSPHVSQKSRSRPNAKIDSDSRLNAVNGTSNNHHRVKRKTSEKRRCESKATDVKQFIERLEHQQKKPLHLPQAYDTLDSTIKKWNAVDICRSFAWSKNHYDLKIVTANLTERFWVNIKKQMNTLHAACQTTNTTDKAAVQTCEQWNRTVVINKAGGIDHAAVRNKLLERFMYTTLAQLAAVGAVIMAIYVACKIPHWCKRESSRSRYRR